MTLKNATLRRRTEEFTSMAEDWDKAYHFGYELINVGRDVPYVDIRVNRLKEMDSHYRGAIEMDWYNDEDRKALVHIGWSCEESSWMCDTCVAKDECRWMED